jgi:hypothetical protein
MKSKPQIKSGWEVEWCAGVPKFADGSCDMDNADFRISDFATHGEAVAFAKQMLPKDAFGSVRVTPFELQEIEPGVRAYHREFTADSEHIED